jgi:hypothetical protein
MAERGGNKSTENMSERAILKIDIPANRYDKNVFFFYTMKNLRVFLLPILDTICCVRKVFLALFVFSKTRPNLLSLDLLCPLTVNFSKFMSRNL